MDTLKHFELYRASLKKDALEGFDDYAGTIPTAKPDLYPKTIDYLKHAFSHTSAAAHEQREPDYRAWVARHQGAMLALFDRMVEDLLWDYHCTTERDLLDLIQNHGWNWFKFCRMAFIVKLKVALGGPPERLVDIVFIPRYSPEFKKHWAAKGSVVLDADEAKFFFSEKKNPTLTHPVMLFKLDNPGQKLLRVTSQNQCFYKPVDELNGPDTVVDWSLPLF
jgi:hypothetical protein